MDKGEVVGLDQIEIEVLWSLEEEGKRCLTNLFYIIIINDKICEKVRLL